MIKPKTNRIQCSVDFDGYFIICKIYKSKYFPAYNNWVAKNCVGKVGSFNYGYDARFFVFEKEDEAIAFKLKWL